MGVIFIYKKHLINIMANIKTGGYEVTPYVPLINVISSSNYSNKLAARYMVNISYPYH